MGSLNSDNTCGDGCVAVQICINRDKQVPEKASPPKASDEQIG